MDLEDFAQPGEALEGNYFLVREYAHGSADIYRECSHRTHRTFFV